MKTGTGQNLASPIEESGSMAVIWKFDDEFGAGSSNGSTRNYLVTGTDNADAYGQLIAHADCPDTLPGATETLYRSDVSMSHVGNGNYEAKATWLPRPTPENAPDEIDVGVSFSTTGGQQLVTQSLGTTRFPGTATDYLGQIGVTRNGVEGVQITVPVFQWSEQHLIPNASATSAYRRALMLATGAVNDATFRTYPAGEVLFVGASGERKTSSEWSVTFSFQASPNVTGLTVGPITGIAKGGWDYLWVEYTDYVDSITERLVRYPVSAHVERVYPSSSFSALGIGS